MRIAITGSTGLIGQALVAASESAGDQVHRMVRGRPDRDAGEIGWDPAGRLDPAELAGLDGVVHLAGEPIGKRPWTSTVRQRIRNSRAQGTTTVAEAVAAADPQPRVLVSASAIGVYGDRGDEVLTAGSSGPGQGFLAEVVQQWEAAAEPARAAGVRVVHPRFGIVQSPDGGLLGRLLPLFRLGLGARMGSGQQWMSWVALADVVGALRHALTSTSLSGPVDVVAPNPVRNAEWTRVLAGVLHRPAALTVPRFAPRLVLGDMADELMFASQRVRPVILGEDGYSFQYPHLEPALRALLERPAG